MLKAQEIIVKDLLERGGKHWAKGPHDRIYINQTTFIMPSGNLLLDLERYNTGNISSAALDGEVISNNKARGCAYDKTYYCKKTHKFFGNNLIVDALTEAYSEPEYDGHMRELADHMSDEEELRVFIAKLALDGVDLVDAVVEIVNHGLDDNDADCRVSWDREGKTLARHDAETRKLSDVAIMLTPYWDECDAPNSVEA